jgi:hypothetical protein
MAGYAVTAADVNSRAGALVVALWQDLENLRQFKAWLDDSSHNDTFLTGLGISAGDITTLRAGVSDLGSPTNGLYAVAHSIYVPGGVNNFFANAKALSGVTYAG